VSLDLTLTSRTGLPLTRLTQYANADVEIPLSDARTARVDLSVHDPACYHLLEKVLPEGNLRGLTAGAKRGGPLDTLLKVVYSSPVHRMLVFWGPILTPSWKGSEGTVTLNAIDPTIWIKQCYHRYGDIVVKSKSTAGLYGYPLNGDGARRLLESVLISQALADEGVQDPGILMSGEDTTINLHYEMVNGKLAIRPGDGGRPTNLTKPQVGDAVWRSVDRGTNAWDTLTNLTKTIEGFDFEFQPIDRDFPPPNGPYIDGNFVLFNTYQNQGRDLTHGGPAHPRDKLVFHYNFGADNLDDFEYSPDANALRNYYVLTKPGGPASEDDKEAMGTAHNDYSWKRYGIMQGWDANGQAGDTQAILESRAGDVVQAYSYPLDNFVLTPKSDVDVGRYYGQHFVVGDKITGQAKKGYFVTDPMNARIRKVTLSQKNPVGTVVTKVECVPTVENDETTIEQA
jgi:hypothetical protein